MFKALELRKRGIGKERTKRVNSLLKKCAKCQLMTCATTLRIRQMTPH
jgi:hypothetical protein